MTMVDVMIIAKKRQYDMGWIPILVSGVKNQTSFQRWRVPNLFGKIPQLL